MDCKHENFESFVKVARITKSETSQEIIGYAADIEIICSQCKMPFQFIGLDAGISKTIPTVNITGTELRVPIKPYEGGIKNKASYELKP